MTPLQFEFYNYKYFPYEKLLAELEVERLLGVSCIPSLTGFSATSANGVSRDLLTRLTYFCNIDCGDNDSIIPTQAFLEASTNGHENPKMIRRQSTRYSAHGLHEYKGKFHPQIVRAALNLIDIPQGARLWDPFCGSGTVLLEGLHQGFSALGTDINPLAIMIANAKLTALRTESSRLTAVSDRLLRNLQKGYKSLVLSEDMLGPDWLNRFPNIDYITKWFPLAVLAQLRLILDVIEKEVPTFLKPVFHVIMSDILREVSFQDPGDLRIRRRKEPSDSYPALELFTKKVHSKIQKIVAAQKHLIKTGSIQGAYEGDSCNNQQKTEVQAYLSRGIHCIISSPPYATALPYIDTQRLSLALLGLADPKSIRKLDSSLIGSREISKKERVRLETLLTSNAAALPAPIIDFCIDLLKSVDESSDGFRRKNVPSLIYRYFAGMQNVMVQSSEVLKNRGYLVLIIGPNRTTLGGKQFYVDTPELLHQIGEQSGLHLEESIKLETYDRYDLHAQNSIREEQLLLFRRI